MSVLSLNGKGINETNELDCLRELVIQGGDDIGSPLTDTQLRATPVPVSLGSYPSGTLAIFAKTAGQTETIPVGAFQIGVIFLTGTGTIGGVDWPVGVPFNIEARTAATIAVVCGSPGTARVQYLA